MRWRLRQTTNADSANQPAQAARYPLESIDASDEDRKAYTCHHEAVDREGYAQGTERNPDDPEQNEERGQDRECADKADKSGPPWRWYRI
jgi:hypothetical protein